MRRLLLAAGIAALALLAQGPRAQAATSPAASWVGLLEDARQALQQQPPDTARALVPLNRLLTAPPDGYRTADALQPVVDDLERTPPDVADAQARLAAQVAVLQQPPGAAAPEDPQAAHRVLGQVYASPPLRDLDAPRNRDWGARLLDFIGNVIGRILSTLGHAGSIALLVALLAILTAVAVYLIRRNSAGRQIRAPEEPAAAGTDPDAEWALAEAAAAAGDHREAVRRAFRSALLAVAGGGRMPVEAAWTTRELLATAQGDGDLLAALAPAAASFERAWYSGRPTGPAEWEAARARCQAVRALARSRRPARR